MNSVPLQSTFTEALLDGKSYPQTLIIGNKNSGKTYTALKIIRFLLEEPRSPYKKFHIVSPVCKFEQADSYAFLKEWGVEQKRDKVVYLYPSYKSSLAQSILMRKTEADEGGEEPSPLVVVLDDMGAACAENIRKCTALPSLCCTSRHRKCLLIFISHSLTASTGGNVGLLSPWTRQNAAWVIAMRCNSASLVKQVFDEFVSLIALSGEGEEEVATEQSNAYLKFAMAFNNLTMGTLKGNLYEMSHEGVAINAAGGLVDTTIKNWLVGYECDKKTRKRKNVSQEEKELNEDELPGDEEKR